MNICVFHISPESKYKAGFSAVRIAPATRLVGTLAGESVNLSCNYGSYSFAVSSVFESDVKDMRQLGD